MGLLRVGKCKILITFCQHPALLATVKIQRPTLRVLGPCQSDHSDKGLKLETSVFESLRSLIYLIDLGVDHLLFPLTQHSVSFETLFAIHVMSMERRRSMKNKTQEPGRRKEGSRREGFAFCFPSPNLCAYCPDFACNGRISWRW